MSAFHPLRTLIVCQMMRPPMIKKSRIRTIWRRTLVVFAIVQGVGLFVFAYDVNAARRGDIAEPVSRLVIAYVAFLAFSTLVLLLMSAVRKLVERTYGSDG